MGVIDSRGVLKNYPDVYISPLEILAGRKLGMFFADTDSEWKIYRDTPQIPVMVCFLTAK